MAVVYFIGGAPRVGKTTLTKRIIQKHPMFTISADTVRDMLRKVLDPVNHAALFENYARSLDEHAMAAFLRKNPQQGIQLQNDESAIVWPSVNELIASYLADGQDVLVEGVEVLPNLIANAPYEYHAIFLGNTSTTHTNTIAEQAHSNPHDWMRAYAKDSIAAWAMLVQSFSLFIKEEASAHKMAYVETHDENFEESLAEAERKLFNDAVRV